MIFRLKAGRKITAQTNHELLTLIKSPLPIRISMNMWRLYWPNLLSNYCMSI